MKLKLIGSKKEYQQYLDWADELFNKKVSPETLEGEKLQGFDDINIAHAERDPLLVL